MRRIAGALDKKLRLPSRSGVIELDYGPTRQCPLPSRFGSSALRLSYHSSVDVACGLVLLFGLGAKALPVWDSRMRGNNLWVGLTVKCGRSKRTCDLTSSIVPQGTSFHRAVELAFLLSIVILCCHAAAASCRLQRNSVPSTQIRCMITASRRASATIAFFLPRRLAICIAQALSQDHLTWVKSGHSHRKKSCPL